MADKPQTSSYAALSRENICRGDSVAMDWLAVWCEYVHAIDDIEDTETSPAFRLRAQQLANQLYTHPFFLKHGGRLNQLIINCNIAYANSVAWEKSDIAWKRQFADWYRHFAQEIVIAVAVICGGYDHALSLSLAMREANYTEHHDAEGRPT